MARSCRRCGCTDASPCFTQERGSCYWVERDLCSHCEQRGVRVPPRRRRDRGRRG